MAKTSKQLQLVEELIKKQRPSAFQMAVYKFCSIFVAHLPLWIFVRTKGLPLSQTSLYEVHPDDVKLTVPFGWNDEKQTDVPMTPVVVFIVSMLVYRALQKAYHNQFLTQEKAIAIERRTEGKATRVGNTGSGLSEAMEANVRMSALSYSLFFVNTFFFAGWALLSIGMLANAPVLINYIVSMLAPSLAIAFLTKPIPQ